jgi:hypothetical protein
MTDLVVKLSWSRGSIELPDGQYLIGRSSACDIVIDEPRVSRRHAQVEVDGLDVHVVDLESRNGVYVNDRPVRRMQALAEGDLIMVGAAELKYELGRSQSARGGRRPPQAFVVLESVETGDDRTAGKDYFAAAPITKTFDDLELIGRVAERALSAGHPQQAEAMVEGHLQRVLDDSLRQREVSEGTVRRAIEIALRLAEATHRGGWFDYAIDLMRAHRLLCSESQLGRLVQLLKQVDRIDPARIRKYVDTLRAEGPTMEELRMAQRILSVLGGAGRPG